MSLPIDTFIKVNTQIQAGAGLANNFGMGLLLVNTPTLDSDQRVRLFTSATEISEYFDGKAIGSAVPDKSVVADATTWFSANPAPKNLYIGRWKKDSKSGSSWRIKGKKTTATPPVSGSTYQLSIGNSGGGDFSDVDFVLAGGETNAQVATKLSALSIFEKVEYDAKNKRYEFLVGTNLTLRAKQASFGSVLGLPSTTGTYLEAEKEGADEDASAAITACLGKIAETSAPSIVMCGSSIGGATYNAIPQATLVELAKACEANKLLCSILDDKEEARKATYTTGGTPSVADEIFGLGHQYTFCTHAEGDENRPDIGLAALLSSQNFNLPSSIITTHMKGLPGCSPTAITATELKNLESKRCNVYTTVGGVPVLAGGYAAKSGTWADAIYWLRWLQNEMELAIFNAQYGSPRFDTLILSDTIHGVMHKASQTGGIARLTTFNPQITQQIRNITGDNAFDGDCTHGYYIWVQSTGDRTPLDRENRTGVFRVWITTSDAIHSVTGDITLGS